jgi:acetylglutamate kinase
MKTVVIKCGGAAMQSLESMETIMQDIAQLKEHGWQVIVVHGGGPEISRFCQKVGIVPQFVNGLRVTDHETMQVVQMVLIGKINKELVFLLSQKGVKAIGLSGQDGTLLVAEPSIDYVGQIKQVNPHILNMALQHGYIPVIAPIAASSNILGLNINADSVAAQIAVALQADHLIFLSNVPGILEDPQDPTTKIDTIKNIEPLIESGKISGGMAPKAQEAIAALKQGVRKVHLIDGRRSHSLLSLLQEKKQIGTTFEL